MTHTYKLTGMTCGSCEAKVKSALLSIDNIADVTVSKENETATIVMNKHVALSELQSVLDSKYTITTHVQSENEEHKASWFFTYKPILLIFFNISIVTFISQIHELKIDYMLAMRHFMAGFFLVFSFFKLLNLKGFAESYTMYDVIAKKIPFWGYCYGFLELILGIAYLVDFYPLVTNSITFIVMSISIIGVLQSVLNKKKIQCACLGAIFNLPMSTVTIIEDALMIVMSGAMILKIIL